MADPQKGRSAAMAELSRLHGILGSNTVATWIREHRANLGAEQNSPAMRKPPPKSSDRQQRERKQRLWEQARISELEAELAEARLRVRLYGCALEVAKEVTGIDVLKKIGERLSGGRRPPG